ncbi:MAG TPA: acyltransferase [Puia sp.]|uniref:acyltransferase family protein n=1 Tax=Puia sp. TaxID=2045100 RepID=UPI002BDBFDB6|nr:acyltransferase [Puia sp.]HVU98875.1 acyltransferase [Puia sp.]
MEVKNKDLKLQPDRIPSLDGWRGVSILLVILGHQVVDGSSLMSPSPFSSYFKWLTWHIYGVEVFFVISGFLITSLLMKELEKTKRISLRDFYIRRIFRILPTYYLLLFVVFLLNKVNNGGEILTAKDFLKSLFFVSDFDFDRSSWTLGHSWSLSVEEQFYLLWPAVFCIPKLRKIVPVFFICMAPLFRIIHHRYQLFGDAAFLLHCDAIFIGAFFAMGKREWIGKYKYIIVGAAAISLFCEKEIIPYSGFITVPFARTLFSGAIICLIFESFKQGSVLYRILNTKGLVRIGLISYSLYLWQQLFFPPSILGQQKITNFPINIPVMFVLAYASYRFVEAPFIKLRKRLLLPAQYAKTKAGSG